jgi:hypothetical protein
VLNDDRSRIEIRDWLGAIGRRAWIVILIPLLAAFAAAVNQIAAPTTYRSIATVTLVDVPTTGPVTSAVDQAVSDFQSAATSVGVLDLAAETAGVNRRDFDISTRRVGQGGVVLVVGTGEDEDAVFNMVDAVAREALRAKAKVQIALLTAQVEAEQRLVDRAQGDYDDAKLETNISLNEKFVTISEKRYTNARDAFNAAQASGDTEQIAEAQAFLDEKTAVIDDIRQLSALQSTLTAKQEALESTQIKLALAEGTRDGADPLLLELPVTNDKLNWMTPALRSALAAAVFGLLIALAIVAFLEVGTTRRRQRRDTRTRVMEKQRRATVPERAAPRS